MMDYTQQVEAARQATGLPEYYLLNTPQDFWTWEAFNLFQEAQAAGFIEYLLELDQWSRGPGISREDQLARFNSDRQYKPLKPISKGELAYFCQRASRRLHLNKGAQTNWAPFEQMFGFELQTMRGHLRTLATKQNQQTKQAIEAFFERVNPYK